MDILVSLVKQFPKNKIKNLKVFTLRTLKSTSKIVRLYNRLYEQRIGHSADHIATELGFESSSDTNFKNLKRELKDRLINTLFLIDPTEPRYTHIEGAYMNCWKEWAAAKILFGKGAVLAGIDLTRRVYIRSVRYEFTELALNTSRTLRMYYATRGVDPKKFKAYHEANQYYQQLFEWESRAEGYYTNLMVHYSTSRSHKPGLSNQAFRYYHELQPILKKFTGYRLHRFARFIQLIGFMSSGDYHNAIHVCDNVLQDLLEKPFVAKQAISSFLYQKLVCHIKLQQYQAGQRAAEEGIIYEVPGTYNWFKNRELSIILALHTKNYLDAYRLYQQAAKHSAFTKLDQVTRESWIILNGYLQYLQSVGHIILPLEKSSPQRFRLARFLNQVPVFSRDKRGKNIPILILQILFMISRHQYQQAINRIETIEKYCTRYLRRDDTFRSNCFIKMLLLIPSHGFHRIAIERHAKPLLSKLASMPLAKVHQTLDIELIPYEDLWPLVLNNLSARTYRQRK